MRLSLAMPLRPLDPASLDCLAALVDEGSFERAAQRLAVTQSAVSQRVRALEAEVGRRLVVRARPLRLTEAGRLLMRYARQMRALHADVERALDDTSDERIAVAVNADSLATWVLPALDALVQQGVSLELIVDDQDHTHEWLREGRVLGCVSTVREALRGCRVEPLAVMRYVAVASPRFVAHTLGGELHAGNFARAPFLVFNRKDALQTQWVEQAFGVRAPRLVERYVPSPEAFVDAARRGWGIGCAPLLQARAAIDRGELVVLHPHTVIDVALYWHQWRLDGDGGLLDRIGAALKAGAPPP
jgi:LysR family transcriptional regulator, chromosome initiation inhibitor